MSKQTARSCLAIVLAAGEGKRMQSAQPKVLHKVAGRSMLGHVLASVRDAGADAIAVVVGPDRGDVADEARSIVPHAEIYTQSERLGTAHAVLAAEASIARGYDDVLVVFADTPLVRSETFAMMRTALSDDAKVVALGFEAANPAGYGRLLSESGELIAIREDKDASDAERKVTLCNAGLMALAGSDALAMLKAIGNDNAQKEYYLTDAVAGARARGGRAIAVTANETEVQGVNDRVQLAAVEKVMQQRLRERAMRSGATLLAPETVYFSHDTVLGRDVVVEPNVFFGPGVAVADNVIIKASSHLEQASVGEGASVGPFARLRPGARLEQKVKVGNFVEIKAARIGAGAAVSHLTYIGDADVGEKANIGAGTITCNYDGFLKYRTEIGAGAFIGSNSALVAPVKIGAGAIVAAGSVVTREVAADALSVARGKQADKPEWAARFRLKMEAQRKK
ncbi:MAG: bifunctional UDP-N-acetylglucosamine diphosphorylase/glucosamine-1-phosphate N-acetyltransferase GlmU [Hyphomicrobiales bacterium]|nr:bifunctional UDP-N-acetylglucosamine diphosphorylase/glucosamine-1-phosphate N-acetyltransferase GlmU [Hyphomicrobiales bacterium]